MEPVLTSTTYHWAGALAVGTLAGSCLSTPLGNPFGPASCLILLGLAASDCGDLQTKKGRPATATAESSPQDCSPVLVTESPIENESSYHSAFAAFATNADGTIMAFSRFFGEEEGRGVFVTNLFTGEEKKISDLKECNYISLDNEGARIASMCSTREARQTFVKDVATGATLLYREGPYGVVTQPALSGSGEYLFYVQAVEGITPWEGNVVRERVEDHDVPEIVSSYPTGVSVSGFHPVPNEKGDLCVFHSKAIGLDPSVVSLSPVQLYLKNLKTDSVTLISATSQGIPAQDGFSQTLGIVEGGLVVFESSASNFSDWEGVENPSDTLVHSKKIGGELTLLSSNVQGEPVAGNSHSVTRDGRFLTFAPSRPSPDFTGPFFVDVKDVQAGKVYRVEDATAGILTPDGSAFIYIGQPYEKMIGTNQIFVVPLYRLATRCFLDLI